jgi:hypothetical protein
MWQGYVRNRTVIFVQKSRARAGHRDLPGHEPTPPGARSRVPSHARRGFPARRLASTHVHERGHQVSMLSRALILVAAGGLAVTGVLILSGRADAAPAVPVPAERDVAEFRPEG